MVSDTERPIANGNFGVNILYIHNVSIPPPSFPIHLAGPFLNAGAPVENDKLMDVQPISPARFESGAELGVVKRVFEWAASAVFDDKRARASHGKSVYQWRYFFGSVKVGERI